ncbi:hypothetical protein RhiirA4_401739 [Rhizophagus irregularis]|uniref:Uncharacterized protein n=1 Tax=Rhizophagus irregularis TaxID=588596 RepID=A0A2I1GGS4_9GLOM|nr:hypothetical protein RhiirA4_401739 [Rhizophagus irregularis]
MNVNVTYVVNTIILVMNVISVTNVGEVIDIVLKIVKIVTNAKDPVIIIVSAIGATIVVIAAIS